ncbi:MAG: group II intron reverse transcriptase/maturase [Calothrix sp. C42_A2020_038]|nr:group II intron reverse transcriptase/maturase [Calothrix sp. C42_A2020_038]
MTKTSLKTMVVWRELPWRKIERVVYKLQKRIYRASSRGDVKTVRRLQKTLMKSWYAKLLAVRRVSQDNQGKKTAGVDGIKSLTPQARLKLAANLKSESKAKPTRRVWIPKPGTDERRPLGIPTMYDRALQALVKLALEPEWEAKFEPNSYGFRPGRSCQDAIQAIYCVVKQKAKYVLDADIAKCFDRIDHEALLRKLNTFPTMRRQIKAWLKAGVAEDKQLFPTSEGTPQGGVISPLLANIALHGMEEVVKQFAETLPGSKKVNRESLSLIRYADDFVILHQDLQVILKCKEIVSEWLKDMGLELKPSKTKIVHTLHEYEQQKPGLNFLGFNIRQYLVGKYQSGKNPHGKLLGFKTLIKPSDENARIHYEQIAKIIETHKAASQKALIAKLNPIVMGWANYYATVVSKETYKHLDYLMYQKLESWANRRHPKKSKQWVMNKYWHTIGGNNWEFAAKEEGRTRKLIRYAETSIVRHVKVKGNASPFDGNLVYWSARMGNNPMMPTKVATLLKRQNGKCAHCGLYFRENDVMEVDHIIPKSKGGKDEYKNLQLLHRHCHDNKTTKDGSLEYA